MTGYVVRSTQQLPAGTVAFTVVDDALNVLNITMPFARSSDALSAPTIVDCIETRPRPPVGP